jgi:hypothetical protein
MIVDLILLLANVLCGALLGFVGIVIGDTDASQKKRLYRVSAFLVLCIVGLTGAQYYRADKAQKQAQEDAQGEKLANQAALSNLLLSSENTRVDLQRKLDDIVVLTKSQKADQLLPAIRALAQGKAPTFRGMLTDMSNDELRKRVKDVVRRLEPNVRAFVQADGTLENEIYQAPEAIAAVARPEREQLKTDFMNTNSSLLAEADFLRDAILIKLGRVSEIKEEKWFSPPDVNSLHRTYDLEKLAQLLPQ